MDCVNNKALTRDEAGGVPLGVQAPDSAAVAVIGAQPFPIQRVPHVGMVVLGTTAATNNRTVFECVSTLCRRKKPCATDNFLNFKKPSKQRVSGISAMILCGSPKHA
jgi:hypothetical protein